MRLMNPGLTIERAWAIRPDRRIALAALDRQCHRASLIVQREIANSIFMARLAESAVRELLNDADSYFYFVQRPSLHAKLPASYIPERDFSPLF